MHHHTVVHCLVAVFLRLIIYFYCTYINSNEDITVIIIIIIIIVIVAVIKYSITW